MSGSPELSGGEPELIDHVRGDATGLEIPAHAEALLEAGPALLTRAFRAFGSLTADNRVTAIERWERCPGGSTGAKFFMTLAYERPDPGLHRELFVKFSRDFTDARRDNRGKWEMASEVPFAAMSRMAGFPIPVPEAMFADYHGESGTGLVITERVMFGEGGIEPHRAKCVDHLTLDDPVAHYRAVVTTLARLCAAHKAGALPVDVDALFPFDPATGSADPIRYSRKAFADEIAHCQQFARRAPQLLPPEVRSEAFLAQMERDMWLVYDNQPAIWNWLSGNPDMIALCHWNAHIDNCWFTRSGDGALECGLIDWGRVGQITFGAILWGGLSAAHHDVWDNHLRELLELFASEYRAHGGPAITADALEFHLTVHMAAMGAARVLAFPEVVEFRLPGCIEASGPLDPMFLTVEPARNSLHIYTVFLKFWRTHDFGKAIAHLLSN